MTLTVQSSAQAYTFSNFDPVPGQPYTASGFFDVDDTLGSIPGEVEFATELIDYEINIEDGGTIVETLIPSNSQSVKQDSLTGVSITATEIDFSTATGGIFARWNGTGGFYNFYYQANGLHQLSPDGTNPEQFSGSNLPLTATAAPTAVPFGVSTDLSLLILCGMYGASRLRKTIAARK